MASGDFTTSKKVKKSSTRRSGSFAFRKYRRMTSSSASDKGYLIQIVGIHKLVEHIGTEHDGLGNGNTGILELFELGVMLHQIVDESQSAPFASQRTVADTGKVGVAVESGRA